MTRPLKGGVVGTGFIGPVHIEALRRLGIEVTGILASTKEHGQKRADALRLPKAYGSVHAPLGDAGADGWMSWGRSGGGTRSISRRETPGTSRWWRRRSRRASTSSARSHWR